VTGLSVSGRPWHGARRY